MLSNTRASQWPHQNKDNSLNWQHCASDLHKLETVFKAVITLIGSAQPFLIWSINRLYYRQVDKKAHAKFCFHSNYINCFKRKKVYYGSHFLRFVHCFLCLLFNISHLRANVFCLHLQKYPFNNKRNSIEQNQFQKLQYLVANLHLFFLYSYKCHYITPHYITVYTFFQLNANIESNKSKAMILSLKQQHE